MAKKEYTRFWLNILLAIAVMNFVVGFFCGQAKTPSKPQTIVLLPNQGQLQQILNAIEPNNPLKVDYCVDTKSRAKWDYIVFNAYAAPSQQEQP